MDLKRRKQQILIKLDIDLELAKAPILKWAISSEQTSQMHKILN